MIDIFTTAIYQPLYNGLIFLINIIPGGDVGIAVVLLTLIVKSILLPLTHKATVSQAKMKKIEPEVKKLKEKYEKDKQQQAQKLMELYKTHNINPFAGCLPILVQIPIILGLYFVFFKGITTFDVALYSFIIFPENINMVSLGLVDMAGKSLILALIAGISQYFQIKISMPTQQQTNKPANTGKNKAIKDEMMKNLSFQMRYVLPIIVFVVSYNISAAVALYWATSNIFSITHEHLVKRSQKTPNTQV